VSTNGYIKVQTDFTVISQKFTLEKLIVSRQTKMFIAEKWQVFTFWQVDEGRCKSNC
jgi:hypothetical protein